MAEPKRVFITVNPDLLRGRRLSTIRSIVTALDAACDLQIVPVDEYDFEHNCVMSYKRTAGGHFEKRGLTEPAGDLWLVYSDGYWLDHEKQGFKKRDDFLMAQINLHEKALETKSIGRMINSPQAEKNCLKDWLAGLDSNLFSVIPTYLAKTFSAVEDLFCQHGILVAKPNWGGSGQGIKKIAAEKDITNLQEILKKTNTSFAQLSFQKFVSGAEKRLWYVNGECVAARITHGRHTPWSADTANFRVVPYDLSFGSEFERDRSNADRIAREAELTIGSVDFIGDQINEINGAGTTFLQYSGFVKIVDARKPLINFLKTQLQ